MTEEKTCYNCGNKNCNVYYSMPKKDYKRHYETYEYTEFDCVKHDKWKEMKVEEIRTDSTEPLKNAKKMTKEELHNHIKSVSEDYISKSWNSFLDLDEIDLIMAGIGVGKIIASEQEKRIEELLALIQAERKRQEQCDDIHLKKIADLEQENAELKGQVEISYEVYNDNLDYSYHIEEQLTEAKKIIGEFVEWANWQGSKCPSFKSIQNKAEQFLKTEALAVRSPKRTQNDPDKLTDDVMNGWKEMED